MSKRQIASQVHCLAHILVNLFSVSVFVDLHYSTNVNSLNQSNFNKILFLSSLIKRCKSSKKQNFSISRLNFNLK